MHHRTVGQRTILGLWTAALLFTLLPAGCTKRLRVSAPPLPVVAQVDGASQSPPDRKLARTATLDLQLAHENEIKPLVERVRELSADVGGYVSEESSAALVMRIPNDRLDDVVESISSMGHVLGKNVTAREVGAEYTDLAIRIDNARKLEARLKQILEKADKVADLLEAERELSRVTVELERLEGQKRLMDNQTTFAVLRLTLKLQRQVRKGPLGWVFYGLYRGTKWLFVW